MKRAESQAQRVKKLLPKKLDLLSNLIGREEEYQIQEGEYQVLLLLPSFAFAHSA
jgi:hypothetical protein